MKKLYDRMNLFQKHIFGFLVLLLGFFVGGIISFCNADELYFSASENEIFLPTYGREYTLENAHFPGYICLVSKHDYLVIYSGGFDDLENNNDYTMLNNYDTYCSNDQYIYIRNNYGPSAIYFYYYDFPTQICSSSTINVLYNNEQSTSTITCNGDNVIQIDGLSTITATNKRTPYFNIDYKDENNQSLIESYSNDILYLSGSLFKKTYTGDNDRILTTQNPSSENTFTGFIPVFDVTGSTATIDTGNMFNNFSDNALKVLLSNIPGYIQYITIFFILLFLFGFIRRFKSKR